MPNDKNDATKSGANLPLTRLPHQSLDDDEPVEDGRPRRNENENRVVFATPSVKHADKIRFRLHVRSVAWLCLFIFVLFPLLPMVLATIFGGLLAWVDDGDGITFFNGFMYVVSNLLGMANPLTEHTPTSGVGVVLIDLYTSVAALISFGIMLNVVNLFEIPHAINNLIRRFVRNAILVPTIALGIIIPAWNAGLSVIFGCILALAEGWPIADGILYVLTNILGLADPLTDVMPDTFWGKVVDVVISSVALGYIAIFADYVTTLNPSRYVRRKLRRFLIKLGIVDENATTTAHPLAYRGHFNEGWTNDGVSSAPAKSLPADMLITGEVGEGHTLSAHPSAHHWHHAEGRTNDGVSATHANSSPTDSTRVHPLPCSGDDGEGRMNGVSAMGAKSLLVGSFPATANNEQQPNRYFSPRSDD